MIVVDQTIIRAILIVAGVIIVALAKYREANAKKRVVAESIATQEVVEVSSMKLPIFDPEKADESTEKL